MPRFFTSVNTCSQNLAPSPPSPAQIPRMSRSPLAVTPMTTERRGVADLGAPLRSGGTVTDLHCRIASTKITGYRGSKGREDHSASSAVTFSVIRLIVSLETFAP